MVTLVARVTYRLAPVRCEVCPRAEPVRAADRWAKGDRNQAYVREPSDVVPMKEAADVVLVGKAYAPGDVACSEVAARLVVGEVDKTLRVTGPRRFALDGAALAPAAFREAPLDWTRTTGGPDTWNPVGVSDREPADLRGETVAPTVLAYGAEAPSRGAYQSPAGFGPLAPTWSPRSDTAPAGAQEWVDPSPQAQLAWTERTRPSFFQCAPPDQRLSRAIRADERLVLENLMPGVPRLVTNLPGVTLYAAVMESSGEPRSIELGADTLWIDTERGIATVTHRAAVPARLVEGRDVVVWLEGWESPASDEEVDATNDGLVGSGTVEIPTDVLSSFEGDAGRTSLTASAPRAGSVTPFRAPTRSPARTAPAPQPLPSTAPGPAAVRPAGAAPHLGASPLVPQETVLAMAAAPVAAPPLAPPPAALVPPAGEAGRPSWAPSPPQPPAPVEALDTRKLHEQAAARRGPDEPLAAMAPARGDGAAPAAASPLAAAPKPVAVEVVWFDSTTEIASASRSRTLKAQVGDGADDEFLSANDDGGTLEIARRDVGRWFRRAAPLESQRLPELLNDALEDEAGTRPFVVLAGELAWSFDPRESLRAWIALGTPLTVDSRVKDAIENAERVMAENVVSVPDVLLAALERLRDSVRANAKLIGQTPIDAAAERWLVEERGFAKRRVWGQQRLRAHLHTAKGRAAIPVYLPDGAGWEAPLSQRFPARVLGEIRIRQDPTEASTVCLRAIGLGAEFVP
jgi:hypothetical protein